MDHKHKDLFHVNEEDYYDEEFVEQQTKMGVLVDDDMWTKMACE
jgi:hypothetical protein